jgi:ABC-type spermidine/putrescine transport system permease subunit I
LQRRRAVEQEVAVAVPDHHPVLDQLLIRVFLWKVILGYNGVINSGLMGDRNHRRAL